MPRAESYYLQWSVGNRGDWDEDSTTGTGEDWAVGDEYVVVTAGGYSGNHYSRAKYDFIDTDGKPLTSKLTVSWTFYLPSDYYDLEEGTVRFFEMNNEANGSYGSSTGDNLDIFFIFNGGTIPRLVSRDDTNSLNLWTGTQLAVETWHTVTIEWSPSQSDQGMWSVDINDGEQSGSATGVQTVPSSVVAADIEITNIKFGLPTASVQDTNLLTVYFQSFECIAWQDTDETPWHWWSPPTSITSPGTVTEEEETVYNLYYYDESTTSWIALQPWQWDDARSTWEELDPLIQYYDESSTSWAT